MPAARTLESYLADLDAFAAAHPAGAYAVYSHHTFLLTVWASGGIPVPHLDPRIVSEFKPFYAASRKFNRKGELMTALQERELAAWNAEHGQAA